MAFTGKASYSAGTTLPELAEDVSDLIGCLASTRVFSLLGRRLVPESCRSYATCVFQQSNRYDDCLLQCRSTHAGLLFADWRLIGIIEIYPRRRESRFPYLWLGATVRGGT